MALSHAAHTVLDRLPDAVRERMLPLSQHADHAAGSLVLREGTDTPFLAVIERGRVALRLRMAERGDRLTLVTVEPSELLGWSALVPPHRVTVDAFATEPTRLLTFDARRLRELLAANPDVAAALLPVVLETVSARLNASWSQLLDVYGGHEDHAW